MSENKILSGLCAVLCLTTISSFAFDRSQEMYDEIIIASKDGGAIRPHVVKLAPDGALILAGDISATRQGWAAKINADRTVAWTYTAALEAEDQTSELRNTLTGPQFNDAVPMPDGTIYLCGKMPHSPQSTRPTAFLTHLDHRGGLIAERLVDIQKDGENRLHFSIDACASFEGGVLALAQESHFPPPGATPEAKASFALLLLDHNQKIRLNQRFGFLDAKFIPVPNGSRLIVLNDAFMAVFTDNRNTEVDTFSLDGKLVARKSIEGRYVAVRNSGGGHVMLYGASEVGGGGPKAIITFDRALNQMASISGSKPSSFVSELVFEMPNQSFAMFGTQINTEGDRLTSSVRLVSKNLDDERFINFPRRDFFDGGTVPAASPTARKGEFAIVRSYAPQGASKAVPRGVVVDYLNF